MLSASFCISCSDEGNAGENPKTLNYIEITDANFEAKLIALGIDTDGKINQKILKFDM